MDSLLTPAVDAPDVGIHLLGEGRFLRADEGGRRRRDQNNRTDRNSPTDPGVTIFGLGVVLTTPFEVNGLTYDKLFYQLK